MKLNEKFITHCSGDESFLVPAGNAGFSGIVRGNKTLGAILELLKTETNEKEIVSSLRRRFDAPEGAVEQDVRRVLEELQRIGALAEPC